MDNYRSQQPFAKQGLYDPQFEHENCGIGAVVNIKGTPDKKVVDSALRIVETLEHRAGKDAEGKTGDGVGILLQISHDYFKKALKGTKIKIGDARSYGIGMFFFPQTKAKYEKAMKTFEEVLKAENLEFLGWREVPVTSEVLGSKALESMPHIMQGFVNRPEGLTDIEFDRKLYVARMVFEKKNKDTYVCSCSCRTIVYKGMFLVAQLRSFYSDLTCGEYTSAVALVHSRFSTNTNPSWQRSHPNRIIVHNGEINTITGNMNKMLSRESILHCEPLEDRLQDIYPMMDVDGSDSARLDNTLEFMVMSGMDLELAIMALIPEPWQHMETMSRVKKAFYQYYATMMEPWDGPASIIFSDGDKVGAVLDRNGLRPSRYYITDDGYLILSSEVGALPEIPTSSIIKKERLRPGKMLLVDMKKGEIIDDETIKNYYATKQPYGEWITHELVELKEVKVPNKKTERTTGDNLRRLQKAFGYSYGNLNNSIIPMALNGSEPTAAMGVDAPVPPLSKMNPPLFNYFKQKFAQVTNPPIDSIRESVITDTTVYLGVSGNILEEKETNCRVLKINNPILTNLDILKIRMSNIEGLKTADISLLYTKEEGLKKAIENIYTQVEKAHEDGATILILTDRGVDETHMAIPSLLAVSALETYLVKTRMNTAESIIVESAEPCEVHHFATLLGMGASAVNPYLALDSLSELITDGIVDKDFSQASNDYIKAVESGIVKIASKMGISTIQSYQGSKIFEAFGIGKELMDNYFSNIVSRVGGIDLSDIEKRTQVLHDAAFDPNEYDTDDSLRIIGGHKSRSGKEDHLYNPETIHLLQLSTWRNDYSLFKQYSAALNREDRHITLRSTLDFHYPEQGISIDEVESVESIMTRFKTGAMSYGSISQEAHECMAIAMNRIGGKSNSGEGGEDLERILTDGTDENRCSAIKQVASARFGVTSKYLTSAKEIQIKMAQGAKPGEGGHLPAKKVYPWIAKTRHSTPGVALISPPPHHDIYSIEDLAQLIYDLKNANKDARISVKLVSEAGVGTVAAGVAKAGAGVVLISGYDGGTGAAPASSIHNAGLPWELGLSETHQTLIANGLRSKVRIETDGKMMTGRDVVIAAMLGAEEYGFATAPLVTMGCVMMRVCNLDTCPVGVATQNPELRKRFKGKPEYIVNFMRFMAQEMREYMAKLGIRTIDELVGRSDLLYKKEYEADTPEAKIDMSGILENPFVTDTSVKTHFDAKDKFDFELEKTIDETTIIPAFKDALETGDKKELSIEVTNLNRTLGTLFGAEITRKYYNTLSEDTYVVHCKGAGGQSFGAFIPAGLTLALEGDSNDYFGKGLSGGKLALFPPKDSRFEADENIVVGNVALFGATSGKAFINGVAGERFCVRNSGAKVVCEGVGDHGCEYMTGGKVVILGQVGKNFAAGMSGGMAYVLDENNDLYTKLNKTLVGFSHITEEADIKELKSLLEEHVKWTDSKTGKKILDSFDEYLPKFKKVLPYDYERMLKAMDKYMALGDTEEEAKIKAFYENTKG